ncbi:MFS transporter [Bacillus marinisedimentorum]|uniref:MFS transporter n=1 Tax=Bacillus marinisedimentorum TaxID=1821260 RepID=UPI0007DEEE7A|nr:MFS transporter [Bacillus marinisedimentorum]
MANNKSVFSLKAFLYFFNSTGTLIISFLPLYFRDKGLSVSEIGTVLSVGPFAALLVQPMSGYLSDKYKTVKVILLICLIGVLISSTILFKMESFFPVLIMIAVFYMFMGPIGPLADSLSHRAASLSGVPFGSIRMWGSIGFAVTSLAGGLVLEKIGIENLMYPYFILASGALLTVLLVRDVTVSSVPVTFYEASRLLKKPELSIFLLLIVFITVAHRTNDSFMGLYIESLGGTEMLIGWAWFIAVAAEALVFATSGLWFRKYHELTFLTVAGLFYSVRFALMSFVVNPVMILFLQPLHGVTFGLFYMASFQYVTKILPRHLLGTGHLLLIAVFFNVSGIISAMFGGMIFERAGADTLYQIIGVSAMIGSLCLLAYKQSLLRWKKAV